MCILVNQHPASLPPPNPFGFPCFLGQIVISKPTDQVFKDVSGDVVIEDAGNNRKLTVSNIDGWKDTVIWNPYGDKGKGRAMLTRLNTIKL